MTISDTVKVDRLFKESQDRRMTSLNKAYYEEEPRNLRVILGNEVWLDNIDSTPTTAVSQGIAFKCAGWMIQDTSVATQQAWYSSGSKYAGGYWKRWIPPKCGQGYTIKIYKSGSGGSGPGTELGTTDVSDWVFDYQEGVLWFQDAPGYSSPYYISGYRYSGALTTKSALNLLYKSANATFSITGSRDIQSWNSTRWNNSGITWDSTLQKWKPKKSGAATTTGDSFDHTIYMPSSTIKSGYYPSALGHFYTGSGTKLHSAYMSASTGVFAIASHTHVGTSDVAWSGAYQFYAVSSSLLSKYANSTNIKYRFPGSSNVYNKTWIDSLSGSIDSRIDALGSFNPANYIVSTTAITRFADSANIKTKFAWSSQINRGLLNSISSNLDTRIDSLFNWSSAAISNYANSANVRFRFMASTNSRKAFASAQALKVHAFHSKISTQYLSRDSGWMALTTGSKYQAYNWTFPKVPRVRTNPSGLVTFGTSVYNINTVGFTAAITAMGNRTLSWEAEI